MLKKIKHHWIEGHPAKADHGQISPPADRKVRLIGAPDDRGVLNVGGRLGAGHAPSAIRAALAQSMLGMGGEILSLKLHRGIDIELGNSIEDGHSALRREVAADLESDVTPIVLGGGHDYGYPHVAGAFDIYNEKVALINIDAHLDVRPPNQSGITSGSPFYLALEDNVVKPSQFVEFGIQEHCNDKIYADYLANKKVRIVMLDDARKVGVEKSFQILLSKFSKQGLKIVVSFDIDAVQMCSAPGVSAPQPDGFTAAEFLGMAKMCGENSNVVSVGFFELAPQLDEYQKTVKLSALAIHRFLCGLSRRGGSKSGSKSRLKRSVRHLIKRS